MGSTHPYYRRSKPNPQSERDFVRNIPFRVVIQNLRDQKILPQNDSIGVRDLIHRFQPFNPGSLRSLLLKLYARMNPNDINLSRAYMESYDVKDPVAIANSLFEKRAAAAISCAVSSITINDIATIMEVKSYAHAPDVHIPTVNSLAAIAYPDYFPGVNDDNFRRMVSDAILAANPGWCGTIGPGIDDTTDFLTKHNPDADYDMAQMHLLQIAYCYYDELPDEAREQLITVLLARGRIHRVKLDDTFTSGLTPNDWSRAGFITPVGVSHKRIGETENHILVISTARYLTNQLLYQRDRNPIYDNRRNGGDDWPNCTELILYLLRNILRDDFSEYNAKPYQHQTRSALLNLYSYAYDHEVRVAARMVLDYISAHIAVSSSDLRRMVPFRRRNEALNRRVAQLPGGFMDVGLVEWVQGADPMVDAFAMQTGNTRVYDTPSQDRPWPWSIASDGGDAIMEVLSDYRLPLSIHDLFVNDLHRRFYQRLHRIRQDDVEVTGRNCDNYEIYAGSPSYLITAGGEPAPYAISPYFAGIPFSDERFQQIGVAVTTSFMPTGQSAGPNTQNSARDLIQFSHFSSDFDHEGKGYPDVKNYGVAPDFACGHTIYLPEWCVKEIVKHQTRPSKFEFVNKGKAHGKPGFFLAILRDTEGALIEAFDTWLHPELDFDHFMTNVLDRNQNLSVRGLHYNVEDQYITQNGNKLSFFIWKYSEGEDAVYGAEISKIEYGLENERDKWDKFGDAGNVKDKFLNGTVLNSQEEGVIEITNHFLGTKITLDMKDQWHPKRISETGEVELAGFNNEVWVDFEWTGPNEGDFFHPFNTIAAATSAVADGGVIKIMPGSTKEELISVNGKRIRFVTPIGGVTHG